MLLFNSFTVSEDEHKRIQEAFKRYSTPAGYMSKAIFARDVFGEGMPQKLAEVGEKSSIFIFIQCDDQRISFIETLHVQSKLKCHALTLCAEWIIKLVGQPLFKEDEEVGK